MAKRADDLIETEEFERLKHMKSDKDCTLAYLRKKGATVPYFMVYGASNVELVRRRSEKTKA